MSNGIRSLPRYQEGGSTDPSLKAKRLRLFRLIEEDRARRREERDRRVSLRPDTLKDRDRANMMYHLNLHGDTTGFTQQGVQDWIQSGELEEGAELVQQLREIAQHRDREFDPVREENEGIGKHGNTDEGYPFPRVLTYGSPGSNTFAFYDTQGADEISLNIPPAFEPPYARGKSNQGDLERGMRAVSGRTPRYTEAQWEQTPEDNLRRTYGHELGHAAFARMPIEGESGIKRMGYGNISSSEREDVADNFSAVLEALRNAGPNDTRRDVLREADRLIYDYPARAREGITRRDGWSDSVADNPRYGTFSDPFVVNPSAKLTRKDMLFGGGTESLMNRILETEQFAYHHLNRGFLETLSDGVREIRRRGIASLRGGRQ